MAELSPGQQQIQDWIKEGQTPTQAQQMAHDVRQDMLNHGADPAETAKYWGDPMPADDNPIHDHVQSNLDQLTQQEKLHIAQNPKEAFLAGLGTSASSLMKGPPTMALGPDASWFDKLAAGAGQMAGDLPFNIAGGAVGAGAAAETGPVGSAAAGGAGMLILPQAFREVAMDYYAHKNGPPRTNGELLAKAAEISWDTVKAGLEGAAGGAAGRVAAKSFGAYGEAAGFIAGQTGASMAMGEALPSPEDFSTMVPLMLLGGAAGHMANGHFVPSEQAGVIADNARHVFAKFGLTPKEMVAKAAQDPAFMSELLGGTSADGSVVAPIAGSLAKDEPAPYKEQKPTVTMETEEAARSKPASVPYVDMGVDMAKAEGKEAGGKLGTAVAEKEPAATEKKPANPIAFDAEKDMPPPAKETMAQTLTPAGQIGDDITDLFYKLEHPGEPNRRPGDRPEATSPAGAMGPWQIMPGTAKEYGLDINRLQDPEYARHGAAIILADLRNRSSRASGGEPARLVDLAVGYNAGAGFMERWIKMGRPWEMVPGETKKYLIHLEKLTGASYGFVEHELDRQQDQLGDSGKWEPPANEHEALTENLTPEQREQFEGQQPTERVDTDPDWALYDKSLENDRTVAVLPDGTKVPAPELVAYQLQRLGQELDLKFMIGPPAINRLGPNNTPKLQSNIRRFPAVPPEIARAVYLPNNPDEQFANWYGLDKNQILYHELGHAFDYVLNGKGMKVTKYIPPGPYYDELLANSKRWKPKLWETNPDYTAKPEELMADAFAAWISDPTVRPMMPLFTKKFGTKLAPYLDAINKTLPVRVGGVWSEPPPPPGEPQEPTGGEEGAAATGGAGGGGKEPPRLPPGPEESGGSGRRGSKRVEGFPVMSEETLQNKILDIVAPEVKTGLIPDWLKPRKLFAAFQSQLKPAQAIDAKVSPGKHLVEDALRWTFGSRNRSEAFYKYGTLTVDPKTNEVSFASDDSFVKAMQQVKDDGGTTAGFWATRLAMRTREQEAKGIETGVDPQLASAWLSMDSTHAKYEKAVEIARRNDHGVIDYGRDSGLYSDEAAYQLKNNNFFHVTMRRVMDPTYTPPKFGRGFLPRNPFKEQKGSERQIVDPATQEIDNHAFIIAMADRNRSMLNIVDAIAKFNGQAKAMGRELIPFEPRVDKSHRIGDEVLEGDLFDQEGKPITPPQKEALKWALAYRKYGKMTPDDFLVFRNGTPEVWRATDPELAQLLRMNWTGQKDPLPTMLQKIASLDRVGITGMLDFPFRAIMHGQIESVFSEGGQNVPYHDVMKGFMSAVHMDDWYKKALINGALTSMADHGSDNLAAHAEKLFAETGTNDAVWNVFKHPIQTLRAAQHMTTAMAQIGMMQRNMVAGKSAMEAAMLARKGYLDYGEGFQAGWVNTWASYVPFMTTGFKDIDQVTRALKENPIGTVMKAGMVMTMPTLINYAVNYLADQNKPEGSRYRDLPQWERDMYWNIPVNGKFLRIKKPYVGGWLFATLPEHFLDWAMTDDPDRFNGWATGLVTQTMPPIIPTALTPPIEEITNHSIYFNKPLIPASLEQNSGYMQYKPDTTLTARAFATVVHNLGLGNLSAIVADNYMREMLGPLPNTALRVLEQPFRPPGRPSELADIPFVGSFFARNPGASDALDQFYDRYNKVLAAHADLREAEKEQNVQMIGQMLQDPQLLNLSGVARSLRNTEALIAAVNRSQMTDAEKLKNIDALTTALIVVAHQGTKVMDMMGSK